MEVRRKAAVSNPALHAAEDGRKPLINQAALERARNARVVVVDAAELNEADRRLADMGYEQVYKREFSWLSCISFALSVNCLYASVATTYVYPLYAGGAASAVWCWLISGAGCMCIALSVAEIVSAYPTSGGMYFTCKYLAPEAWVPEISWICGWLTIIGSIAGMASTEYGTAQLILAAVSMNTNFAYTPDNRQTVGVMAAILLFHGAINSMSTRWLEKLTKTYVVFHVAVLVSCCVALLVVDQDKHSSSYVWTDVTPRSGWSPAGFSFLFGFLSVSWTMTDYDATAHIAEETTDPGVKVPWSITLALTFTYIAGWLFTIVLTYCSGDISALLESPIQQPVAQIFYNVLGRRAGCFFTVCAAIILNFGGITGLQGTARAFWAVARDEMVPFAHVWTRINKTTQTPIYAVWFIAVACMLINLIGLGSYTAIAAIFNITAITYDWSYAIPILCKMACGRFEPGPFHLGRYSYWVNMWAVAWSAFASVIFVLPNYYPVTAANMNYACLLLGASFIFAISYWYLWGRRVYIGPRMNVRVVGSTERQRSSEGSSTGSG